MKKYINKVLVAGAMLLAFGCSEADLIEVPTHAYTPESALTSPENMNLALNGIHREMYGQSPLDGYSPGYAGESYIMPMMDFPAGDYLRVNSGSGWFKSTSQWINHTDNNSNNVSWTWAQYYHIISSVNAIINAAEGMDESETLNSVLGQCYAYRAFAHHRLVSLYGRSPLYTNATTELGVPIMLATVAPYEGQARATVAEVYAQCEADIAKSIVYLKDVGSAHISNISLDAANGIAARIAMSSGKFADAATFAATAKEGYSLMSEADYRSGFNSKDNSEWMWGAEVVADQTNYYRSFFYYVALNFNGSFNRGAPRLINENLFAQISATDYRRDIFLDKAPDSKVDWESGESDPNYPVETDWDDARDALSAKSFNGSTRYTTRPYMCAKFLNENGATIEPEDVLYMRASEMYLIEAEALAKSGNDAGAATILFELVSCRDAAYVKSTNTGQALVDEILLQRRIELFGEGHRWLDMLRNDEALDLTGSGADPSFMLKGFKQDKPSVNDNWLYQIPLDEMNANPLMVRNPKPNL